MSETRQIMTVLGPLAPDELGPTDAHEHLFMQTPALPDDTLADFGRAVAELEEAKASGLRAVVELTPIGLGRRPDLLVDASQATGVAIVAATGFHRDAHYATGHWVFDTSIESLAARVVADLREGMQDGIRAGVIKGGASFESMSSAEERRLRAVAAAAVETGAPVFVHTEAGTYAPEIVNLLLGEGVAADRVTLAHLDRNPDIDLHVEMCARGVNLVYDTIGRHKYAPDSARVELIEAVVGAGYGGQLMLGLDLGRRSYFRSYGGEPGLRHLLASFVPALRERVGDDAVDAMLVANPARILAMPA
jgi:predicted metal-dependent phosphotriesterase family hydrolase